MSTDDASKSGERSPTRDEFATFAAAILKVPKERIDDLEKRRREERKARKIRPSPTRDHTAE